MTRNHRGTGETHAYGEGFVRRTRTTTNNKKDKDKEEEGGG